MSTTNPLVSVAVATYNGEEHLNQQIDSILDQTYDNIEVIVCDDASTDRTREIIASYKDKRIKLTENSKNLGYVKNFEKALSMCSGEYIALCDQDDIWHKKKIETLVNDASKNQSLAIYSNAELIDSKGQLIELTTLWDVINKKLPFETLTHKAFYLKNCITGCTMLIHRSLLGAAMPLPKDIPHDWWLAFHAAYQNKLTHNSETLIQYRQHAGNAIGVVGTIRRSRLSFYFRHKIKKLTYNLAAKQHLDKLQKTKQRLIAMRDFERTKEGAESNELALLLPWVDAKLNNKPLDKYKNLLSDDNEVFTMFRSSAIPDFEKPLAEELSELNRAVLSQYTIVLLTLFVTGGIIFASRYFFTN